MQKRGLYIVREIIRVLDISDRDVTGMTGIRYSVSCV